MRIIVLHGKEPFLLTERTRQLAEALREAYGEIEQFSFDGETTTIADVLDELRSYGLIQRHKLVILEKADEFLAEKDPPRSGAGTRARRLLEQYAESPMPEATLLMRADTWRPGKLDKLIAKAGGVFKIEPPTLEKAMSWCDARVRKRYDTTIEPAASERLVALIGADLGRLDTELAKLAAFAGPGRAITSADVAELVGLSREEKAWAIQSAVTSGDVRRALVLLHELLDISRQPQELVTWSMCDVLRKLHAASQMLRQGVPEGAIRSQLRLFGDSQGTIMALARANEPAIFARLFDRAIRTDQGNKSGLGEPVRSLEALTVTLADSMSHRSAGQSSRR